VVPVHGSPGILTQAKVDMMQNGFNWENKFGEKWNAMSTDERNMALYMAIVEFYQFARRIEMKYSELPCQDCDDNTALSVENIKGKFSIKTALVSGGLVLLGILITTIVNLLMLGA